MIRQLPKVSTLKGVVSIHVYTDVFAIYIKKNLSLYLLLQLIYLFLKNRKIWNCLYFFTFHHLGFIIQTVLGKSANYAKCVLPHPFLSAFPFNYFSIFSLLSSLKNAKSPVSFSSHMQNSQVQGPTLSHPVWVLLSWDPKLSLSLADTNPILTR